MACGRSVWPVAEVARRSRWVWALLLAGLLLSGAGASVAASSGSPRSVFVAEADASVAQAHPESNYGPASSLRVDGGSHPDVHSFVRFTISGLSGAVTSAKLRLYATSATVDGPAVYATATDWSERGITWATRPAPVGAAGDDKGAVPKDTWVEFDVTPLVEGNGVYAFVLIGSSNDPVDMSSREGRRPPQLVVTTAADTTAPSAPAGLAATGVSGNSVSLGWSARRRRIRSPHSPAERRMPSACRRSTRRAISRRARPCRP